MKNAQNKSHERDVSRV